MVKTTEKRRRNSFNLRSDSQNINHTAARQKFKSAPCGPAVTTIQFLRKHATRQQVKELGPDLLDSEWKVALN